jgi:hypothetical protein
MCVACSMLWALLDVGGKAGWRRLKAGRDGVVQLSPSEVGWSELVQTLGGTETLEYQV